MHLLIAARKSDLARLQAYQVGEKLEQAYPDLKVSYHFRESLGDVNQEDPLWKMPEKGVFTEDFREGLIAGHFDMVVHSWKDLPIDQQTGTAIVATLPRADSRDLLLLKKDRLREIKKSGELNIFSSSPRRIYNLTDFFVDYFPGSLNQVHFHNVRGNILTRIRKMQESDEVDGLIVAKAAIDRLLAAQREEFLEGKEQLKKHLKHCVWQVLPLCLNPTAAAQGALAIEISEERPDLKELLQSIHCASTWDSVASERNLLKRHGGGCHQKIGVSRLSKDFGEVTYLRGETESGEILRALEFDTSHLELRKPFLLEDPWFEREEIAFEFPEKASAHYISRSSALPEVTELPAEQVVWVSGLKTWKVLARRGLWVHGSSESLGEQEDPAIQNLAGELTWAKWTHADSPPSEWAEKVSTYRLKALPIKQDLSEYSEFYWMSGSQFKRAVAECPEVLKARHFCGPGNTFLIIREVLKSRGINTKPIRLPGYHVWQNLLKDKSS